MIKSLDKAALQTIRFDLEAALKAVAVKHGIVLKTGNCRFTSTSAKMNLDIATVTSTGEVIDPEASALRANLAFLGLTEEHLTKTIKLGSQTFKITGYKRARYAKPFSLRCLENGKTYVAKINHVRAALGLPLDATFLRR